MTADVWYKTSGPFLFYCYEYNYNNNNNLAVCVTDLSLLTMASRIVQRSLSQEGFGSFEATWIFVVTWYNVSHSLDNEVKSQY